MGAVHASRTAFSASAHSPQGLRDLCWALIIHKRFPFARDHRQHNQRLGREQAQNGLMKDVAQGIKKRGVLLRLNLPCVTQRVRRQRCDVSARCSRAPTCAGQRNSSWILLAARFLDPERLPPVAPWTAAAKCPGERHGVMMMPFICSFRNKNGCVLVVYF